uniref:Uncharacterized protein n=1 Tax=Araucaria cunninghamii TaxID=56994 RepID=A0A0D6R229_ARACU
MSMAARCALLGNTFLNNISLDRNNSFSAALNNRNNLFAAALKPSNLLSGGRGRISRNSFKVSRIFVSAASKDGEAAATVTSEKSVMSVAEADKVSAVLFDMDGVLCNSEEASRLAAVDMFAEMGVQVTPDDFIPFMGTGEANFLGGVAKVKGVKDFDPRVAKELFYEIYLKKYARPNSGLGYPGALDLIMQCKKEGLKVAVASSADRKKIDANMAAAGIPLSNFDAIIGADSFMNLKPAPDIFLAAAKALNVPPNECVVIEDAVAGIQAANAAKMRCIAVTTTLSEEKLWQAGTSLVRRDIGNISLSDILNCRRAGDYCY